VFASDEHRLGLKPVTRRFWAPIGERPIAPGHHGFNWLYVTAFVSPATGETFWYVHDGVSKQFFEKLLATFAREAAAGVGTTIVLVIDNAGWHGEVGLKVPEGLRLVFLPPYTPELQPAETLWALGELKEKVEELCTIAERAKGATGVLSLFGHTSSGVLGAAAYGLYDNWNAVVKAMGLK
jgi:DDE superfamily endonuclease